MVKICNVKHAHLIFQQVLEFIFLSNGCAVYFEIILLLQEKTFIIWFGFAGF